MRATLLALSALAACSGSERRAAPPPGPGPVPAPIDAAQSPDAAPPLEEAAARALLFAAFRASGLRVLQDYRLREGEVDVTLDGFDPDRGVGYEYVAAEERGTDLGEEERAALARLPELRILVLDATRAETLEAAAERFLGALEPK